MSSQSDRIAQLRNARQSAVAMRNTAQRQLAKIDQELKPLLVEEWKAANDWRTKPAKAFNPQDARSMLASFLPLLATLSSKPTTSEKD